MGSLLYQAHSLAIVKSYKIQEQNCDLPNEINMVISSEIEIDESNESDKSGIELSKEITDEITIERTVKDRKKSFIKSYEIMQILHNALINNDFFTLKQKQELAIQTNLTVRQVQNWLYYNKKKDITTINKKIRNL